MSLALLGRVKIAVLTGIASMRANAMALLAMAVTAAKYTVGSMGQSATAFPLEVFRIAYEANMQATATPSAVRPMHVRGWKTLGCHSFGGFRHDFDRRKISRDALPLIISSRTIITSFLHA